MSEYMGITNRVNQADIVLIPKGDNRRTVTNFLVEQGLQVPDFEGRRLHRFC